MLDRTGYYVVCVNNLPWFVSYGNFLIVIILSRCYIGWSQNIEKRAVLY